jgi:hypothetical protein
MARQNLPPANGKGFLAVKHFWHPDLGRDLRRHEHAKRERPGCRPVAVKVVAPFGIPEGDLRHHEHVTRERPSCRPLWHPDLGRDLHHHEHVTRERPGCRPVVVTIENFKNNFSKQPTM